jgi:hypothetical protein
LADAEQYVPQLQTDTGRLIADSLLVPLGHTRLSSLGSQLWSDSFRRFRQTEAFRQIIRDAGVLAYWQQHRFPPLCRPVGSDGFECD